ncbi:hypothetical protein CEXT_774231 [Caerostris extrusa]|uniref:Uncharacterized protein n=1 Tax=Caerostris extrusa TaxID=172846 RepID=A0AAV4V4C6_CAEEX|nr:hypothetical protein CEXT_774231 [Caerostris extrusa]
MSIDITETGGIKGDRLASSNLRKQIAKESRKGGLFNICADESQLLRVICEMGLFAAVYKSRCCSDTALSGTPFACLHFKMLLCLRGRNDKQFESHCHRRKILYLETLCCSSIYLISHSYDIRDIDHFVEEFLKSDNHRSIESDNRVN